MTKAMPTACLAAAYLAERVARREISQDTARNDRCILRQFAQTMGDRPPASIDQAAVETWMASVAHLSIATRRDRFCVVRGLLRWCVRRGVLERDPTLELRAPRQPRSVPRALKKPVVARTLAAAPDSRSRAIVVLMVQEGLRCCEVARLELGDVDLEERSLRVVGKGGHERILPITDETLEALIGYLGEHPATSGPLIRSYRQPSEGLRADTISGVVSRLMTDAGVKRRVRDGVSAHAFRHTCASDMLRRGAHIRDVQHALGHAHVSTTEIYLPLVVYGLQRAMSGRRYGPARGGRSDPTR